eukprot:jgi/Psemu1/288837/fgenesh1_pg.293_\
MKFVLNLAIGASWSMLFRAIEVSAGDECKDNESYRYYGDDWKDCNWIHDNNRCDRHDNKDDKHVGQFYCPKSCGLCAEKRDVFVFKEDDSVIIDDDKSFNNDDNWHGDDHWSPGDDDWAGDDYWSYDDDHWTDDNNVDDGHHTGDNWHHQQCDDYHGFHYDGQSWKDCKWVADENVCNINYHGKNIGKHYCPRSCGFCDDDWNGNDNDNGHDDGEKFFCFNFDDEDFRYGGIDWKDCKWVADEGRCNYELDGRNIGKTYCPLSCGHCDNKPHTKKPTRKPTRTPTRKPTRKPAWEPTRKPTIAPVRTPTSHPNFCHDDKDYRYDGHYWKDCSWVSNYGRCNMHKNGKHVGEYYCPQSCGYCDHWKPTSKPTSKPISSPCQGDVNVDRFCYGDTDIEDIKVFFKNCNSHRTDWVGIYEPHHNTNLGDTKDWWGNPYMWQFTCGSKNCDYKKDEGTLHFRDWWFSLQPGEYRAYLFGERGFDVKAKSLSFKIGNCNDWNDKPTRKPTAKPTSSAYCNKPSSVKVDEQCYKDKHPEKLKVFFENCRPEGKDWIGVFQSHNHRTYVSTEAWWGASYLWMYACGSQNCNSKTDGGTLYFNNWWSYLNDGEYKAYLFKNDGYEVKAESETFKVGNWC